MHSQKQIAILFSRYILHWLSKFDRTMHGFWSRLLCIGIFSASRLPISILFNYKKTCIQYHCSNVIKGQPCYEEVPNFSFTLLATAHIQTDVISKNNTPLVNWIYIILGKAYERNKRMFAWAVYQNDVIKFEWEYYIRTLYTKIPVHYLYTIL